MLNIVNVCVFNYEHFGDCTGLFILEKFEANLWGISMEYIIDGVNFDTADRDSHIYLRNLFILFIFASISLINVLLYDLFRTNGCQI